ncbi:hypothetical protein Hypma_005815 [Hypsizygus marmoreus]|uniref:F-box domain-containing protein n=1 Tax=Hypsizygus marmoreus TaxID=39966 RepID=A0A369KCM4_HYPMA|nr:hypothetical protein Hypma_005815 [Hypsizygus marmoreus]
MFADSPASESLGLRIESLSFICESISFAATVNSADVRHAEAVLLSLHTLGSKIDEMTDRSASTYHFLLSQQEQVTKCIRDVKSITSPARWLPNELIGEILQHYLSAEPFIHLPLHRDNPNPFFFGHICQRWRCVALTTSAIWASFRIEVSQCFKAGYETKICGLIDLCMERSAKRSLNIQFTVFPMVNVWPRCAVQEGIRPFGLRTIFLSLLLHSHRWGELHMDVSPPVLRTLLQGLPMSAALQTPSLRVFGLKGGVVSDDPRHIRDLLYAPLFNLSSATSLRKVSLRDNGLLAAHRSAFPWRVLEELSLVGTHPGLKFHTCFSILRQCSRLKHCQLAFTETTHDITPSNIPTIVLNALESLHIIEHGSPDGDTDDLYRYLVCPNLQKMTFQFVVLEPEEPESQDFSQIEESIAAFLGNSPLLTTLIFYNIPVSERGLLDILGHVQHITHLTLANWGAITAVGNQLLYELTVRPPHHRVLLRQLAFIHIASRGYSEHFLSDFIHSRWHASGHFARLKEVRLNPLGNFSLGGLHSRLRECEEEGLKLVILEN